MCTSSIPDRAFSLNALDSNQYVNIFPAIDCEGIFTEKSRQR